VNVIKYRHVMVLASLAMVLSACSTMPSVTKIQKLPDTADAPYDNILVIALLASYTSRKGLERQVVSQLAERGTKSVASTSMMKTTTPMTKENYLAMIDEIGADAVLISRLVDLQTGVAIQDASPEATYNIRPTYYFNVWDVNLTEYIEPPFVGIEGTYVLATQVYSVSIRDAVWAIESTADFEQDISVPRPYLVYLDEATSIVHHLSRDGVIAK
jgi:hypothetical protein